MYRCKTQIHIDFDQRCNCFIKYTNLISDQSSRQVNNKFKPCSIEGLTKKEDDQYDLDDNTYAAEREPGLYTAKKEEQLFSSKIICPKELLSKCFAHAENNTQPSHSCIYNKILEGDSLKLKQYHDKASENSQEELDTLLVVDSSKEMPEPTVKAAASILSDTASLSEIVQRKDVQTFQSPAKSSNLSLIEKNFKFICIGLAVVFLVSITSLSLTVYLLIKRRNHIVYHPTDGYPQDER